MPSSGATAGHPGAAGGPAPGELRVRGVGEVEVAPDRCVVHGALVVDAAGAGDALGEAARLAEQVADAVVREGPGAARLRTTDVTLHPRFQPPEQRLVGYAARYQFHVVVDGFRGAGELLAVLARTGGDALQIHGLALTASDPEVARRSARRAAVADALQRATDLAAAAGVALGAVRWIEEATVGPVGPVRMALPLAAHGGGPVPPVPIEPAPLTVKASVVVTYALA